MNDAMRNFHQRNLNGHKAALARAEAKRDRKQIAEQTRLIAEIEALLAN